LLDQDSFLWLGTEEAATSFAFLDENNVTVRLPLNAKQPAIIRNVGTYDALDGRRLLNLDAHHLYLLVQNMCTKLIEGKNVVVYCEQGHNRGARMIVLFLAVVWERPIAEIYHYVQCLRPIVDIWGKDWMGDMQRKVDEIQAIGESAHFPSNIAYTFAQFKQTMLRARDEAEAGGGASKRGTKAMDEPRGLQPGGRGPGHAHLKRPLAR